MMSLLSFATILAAVYVVFAQRSAETPAKETSSSHMYGHNGSRPPTTDPYTASGELNPSPRGLPGIHPSGGWFAHDPVGSDSSSRFTIIVSVLAAIGTSLILVISVVLVYYRLKKSTRKCYKKVERDVQTRRKLVVSSQAQISSDVENEGACLQLGKPSRQQIIIKLECYRELSVAIDVYHGGDKRHTWAFGSCIYSLEPHGSEGPFVVRVGLSVDPVRNKEGKLLTEFCVWHSSAVEGVAPLWKCMPDVKVKIGEDDRTADLVLPHLCRICLEARGDFLQKLIVLPFIVPVPESNLVKLILYFERMPCSRDSQSEQDMVRERDKLIERHKRVSGIDAVFCGSEKYLTVKSTVRVNCSLPQHVLACVPWKGGDAASCKILTENQLEGLCHGEPHACLFGPCVEFVVQLAERVRMGHPLCFGLTYSDCQNRMIDSHTIICTHLQSTTPEEVAFPVSRGLAAPQGTVLCDVLASICLPDVLDAFGVWEKLACYCEWHYTVCQVDRIKRDAGTQRRKEGEVFFLSLMSRVADVTIEKLVAVAYSMDLGGVAEDIRQRACHVGQFDAELCDSLLKEINRKSARDYHSQNAIASQSHRQLSLRSSCGEIATRSKSKSKIPKWVRGDLGNHPHRMTYLVDPPCAVAGIDQSSIGQSSIGPVPDSPPDTLSVVRDSIEMQDLSGSQVMSHNHSHCFDQPLGNEAAPADVLHCSSAANHRRVSGEQNQRQSFCDVRHQSLRTTSCVTVVCRPASPPPPTLDSARGEQEQHDDTPTQPLVLRRPPHLPLQNGENGDVVPGGGVILIDQATVIHPHINIGLSLTAECEEDLLTFGSYS